MFRSRTAIACIYWTAAVVAVLAAMCWLPGISRGAIADCMDATCRITTPRGERGTGCVFEITRDWVYVLTAAHVVGDAQTVECEFWRQGHQSQPLAGRVTARAVQADAAIIALPQAAFGPRCLPRFPWPARLRGPAGRDAHVGRLRQRRLVHRLQGHALKLQADELRFVPTPANGRSGSAIFDAEGRQILAIVRARTGDDAEGIATPVAAVYRAFDVGQVSNLSNPDYSRDRADRVHGYDPVDWESLYRESVAVRGHRPFPPAASRRLRHPNDRMRHGINRCRRRPAARPRDAGRSSRSTPDMANWRKVL